MEMKRKVMWIGCILAALVCGCAANATTIMTLEQAGPNVVATGSGMVDLTGLTRLGEAIDTVVSPYSGVLTIGGGVFRMYSGTSGPSSFGDGMVTGASTESGDGFGVWGQASRIFVPEGYVSGTPLSGEAAWDNTTIAALGAIVGTYTWTWGSGANADSLTLNIIPEPSTWSLLGIGFAALAAITYRRRRSGRVLRDPKTPISPISSGYWP